PPPPPPDEAGCWGPPTVTGLCGVETPDDPVGAGAGAGAGGVGVGVGGGGFGVGRGLGLCRPAGAAGGPPPAVRAPGVTEISCGRPEPAAAAAGPAVATGGRSRRGRGSSERAS